MADDEWSDNCSDAETITPGTYSGNLSPEDTDAFRVKLSEGDFINGTLSYDIDRVGGITLWPYPEPGGEPFASEFSITIESEGYDSPQSDIDVEDYDRADDNPARFRLYNEGPKDE
ncbi:hypothetical protein, partial [Haloarcula vallismortis]|uniref:hypothetical protein n=1 Tax=Haloarcula vallismortis TaxID=28442 RepID=UPI0012670684